MPNNQPSPSPAPSGKPGIDGSFSSLLDALRWLSAMVVLLGHVRALSWVQGSALVRPTVALKAFYALTSMGVEAVAVFFVLSGFLVGGTNYTRFRAGRFDLRFYAIDRTTRIYTVLIPVLLFVAVVDMAGRGWLAGSLYYTGSSPLIAERFGSFPAPVPSTFAANLLALQDFYAPVFGSDVPLWSLSYEIWFYVLAGACLSAGSTGTRGRIVLAAAVVAAIVILGPKFLFFLALWLIGVLAHRVSRCGWHSPAPLRWVILALLPVAMLASAQIHVVARMGQVEIKPLLVVVALVCGLLLVAWASSDSALLRRSRRFNGFMASFSFTLYLIHFPVALFAIAAFVAAAVPDPSHFAGFQPLSGTGLIAFAGATGTAMALAIGGAALTEWQTAALRRRIR